MQIPGQPSGTIAVGVDGSASSEHALAFAIEQAVAEQRPLTLVHALARGGAESDRADPGAPVDSGTAPPPAQRMLVACREVVERRASGLEVHELVQVADPRNLLLSAARAASLVIVGSRGRGPAHSLLLGSVGLAVTRHAACPVVIVRPGNPGLVRQGVLVGADGTERSREVVEFAFRQASLRDLPLTVVHAYWDVPSTIAAARFERGEGEGPEVQRLLMADAVSGLRESYPDVPVRTELAQGLPDECLLRIGQHMDLVVVGSHRDGAASEVLFGSVAASVVERATCPVAVVPTGDRG